MPGVMCALHISVAALLKVAWIHVQWLLVQLPMLSFLHRVETAWIFCSAGGLHGGGPGVSGLVHPGGGPIGSGYCALGLEED